MHRFDYSNRVQPKVQALADETQRHKSKLNHVNEEAGNHFYISSSQLIINSRMFGRLCVFQHTKCHICARPSSKRIYRLISHSQLVDWFPIVFNIIFCNVHPFRYGWLTLIVSHNHVWRCDDAPRKHENKLNALDFSLRLLNRSAH